MRYLGPYDVLAIAARVLRCSSADAVQRTDLNAVERVLDSVRLTSGLAESAGVRGGSSSSPRRRLAVSTTRTSAPNTCCWG
ncbi:hypothetical protein [Kribbella jiaozuonensis]|uniref:hypothetical protein n=1 Tax=Kribbella jiaozuonensis TaxID=2575441 RepID=UPI001F3D672E|nr:hypothetical protein [Kribbella jiaozuonensis]